MNFRVRLTPKESDSETFMEEIKKRLKFEKYKCRVQIRQGGALIYGPKNTSLFKEGETIVFYTGDLPAYALAPGAVLEVDLEMGDMWTASLDSFMTLQLELDRL